MKKILIILTGFALAQPLMAQQTNEFRPRRGEKRNFAGRDGNRPGRPRSSDRSDWSEQQRKEHQTRRLQLMDKALSKIGVTEEERIQVVKLQNKHRELMAANSQRAEKARNTLSRLQNEGASEAELDAAIDAVSAALAEQLKILVRNRMEMERILGKEKNDKLMESARVQFRKHGRYGGPGFPPRPDVPPLPTDAEASPNPPAPK